MKELFLYNDILSDISNFVLVVFGFSMTLFTVLYSLIMGKREVLIEYAEEIKNGSEDVRLHQRHANAKRFIHSFKNFNNHLIRTVFINFIVYLLSMTLKYTVCDVTIKKYCTLALGTIAIIIIGYVAVVLIITIDKYKKATKIK